MDNCLFCKIANKELNSQIVYEDDLAVAFKDIHPKAPTHILVVPKKHLPTHLDLTEEDNTLIGHVHLVINKIAKESGLDQDGFRVVINCKEPAGQTVFHLHFHLMGGRIFNWPPG